MAAGCWRRVTAGLVTTLGVSASSAQATWLEATRLTFPYYTHLPSLTYVDHVGLTVGVGGFGGPQNTALTHGWDGRRWSVLPVGAAPLGRERAGTAYDPLRRRLVLFGGQDARAMPLLGDTWEWDGASWTQVPTPNAPSARVGHAMTFDATSGRILLFGGWTGPFAVLGDTWAWDGSTWQQLAAGGPSPRTNAAMTFDPATGSVLLFGGTSAPGVHGDTWLWNGAWRSIAPASAPSARYGHGLTADRDRGSVVLFGGVLDDGFTSFSDESWEFQRGAWRRLRPFASPPGLGWVGMCRDPVRKRTVLYGGWNRIGNGSQYLTWELRAGVEILGPGQETGGLPLVATGEPVLGAVVRLSYPNASRTGIVLLEPGPPALPPVRLPVGLTCGPGLLHPILATHTFVPVATDPGTLPIPIPNQPALVGGELVLQAASLGACITLSEGLSLLVMAPY